MNDNYIRRICISFIHLLHGFKAVWIKLFRFLWIPNMKPNIPVLPLMCRSNASRDPAGSFGFKLLKPVLYSMHSKENWRLALSSQKMKFRRLSPFDDRALKTDRRTLGIGRQKELVACVDENPMQNRTTTIWNIQKVKSDINFF